MMNLTQSLTAQSSPLTANSLHLSALAQMSRPRPSVFKRRNCLPTHGERLWLLKSGVVRTLTYQEDGSTIALGIWHTGDIVGASLSKANPYLIEALTDVEAISVAASEWQPPTEVLLSYLQQAEALMLVRASWRGEIVLLGVLQWLADRFGQQIDRGYLIDLKVTHQDLADFSGLTRVTVTRLLKQFEEQGLIYRRSRQVILAETTDHWHYEI